MNNQSNFHSDSCYVQKEIKIELGSTSLDELIVRSIHCAGEIINTTKKPTVTYDQIERIIKAISINLRISEEKSMVGIMLLFLQGAVSTGAPLSMSVEVESGVHLDKRTLLYTCKMVTGHEYLRRIAEQLAIPIGYFAQIHGLKGELATRINNRVRAETGKNLTSIEMAYCSSFSQQIPNLTQICGSERLVKLLAEDYQNRFDNTKKNTYNYTKLFLAKVKKKKIFNAYLYLFNT